MKVLVTFSGGKDSLASLLWVQNNLTKDFVTVFCDTGWEHPLTYQYIEDISNQLELNLITIRSKKFDGMVDLAQKKLRWPSSQRRFCTSELKTIPMIDYVLDEINDDILMIQGIRSAESAKRAEMRKQCTYFKYYVQPYGKDKHGKDKFHTYRRKDVLEFRSKHSDDLLRPVFDWSAQQVIDYILDNGLQPNPLYRMGYKRVGCYPCIMASQQDMYNISVQDPNRIEYIASLEQQLNSSFCGPDKIPSKYYKGAYPLIGDIVRYVQGKRSTGSLFNDDDVATSCMSYYGLCE
ncbi:phosphoadenosine phosphosulfate reductase family protein [uncultured Parabacteroides sp.]|jgi:3'-phosphoadenosine 5'-phosphosulfate sulfotransferase (PAPS reductase)/FAD synthetase|uniref:phosphoadenosine phosphosulfate reductase family protein n=1 Tax=uncultured Parabacteroides sp. TaxID=512312 RepID=UPI00206912EE|nr:phosphoadenosine phosphosulfate reductase family protein [uncultured Parabacteroides sp.]DAJ56801.1 MAG TPA: phosphoadenosine-phosphosulfate reductase [Caudoviricetes sp.]